jgi:hypothetical protein
MATLKVISFLLLALLLVSNHAQDAPAADSIATEPSTPHQDEKDAQPTPQAPPAP